MKLKIHLVAGTVEVEAFETSHPELAIHQINVRDLANGESGKTELGRTLGKTWAVTHIPSGKPIIFGLLSKDLATMTAEMLTASGYEFGPGKPVPFVVDSFQAAASLMTDCYFSTFYQHERGQLARA